MNARLLVLAVALVSALQDYQGSDVRHYIECMNEAESYMEQGEYWSACNSYHVAQDYAAGEEELALAQEGEYRAWMDRGRDYVETKAYESAVNVYKMIIEKWPDRGDTYWELSEVYETQGKYGDALLFLEQGAACGDDAARECQERMEYIREHLRRTGCICSTSLEKKYKETFDAQGRLVEREDYSNDCRWIYEYAGDGGYSKYCYSQGEPDSEEYYDAQDHLLKEVWYGDDGEVTYLYEAAYNEDGNKEHASSKWYWNGETEVHTDSYEYDAAGRLVKEVGDNPADENGNAAYRSVTTYSYDSAGNLVKELFRQEEDGLVIEKVTTCRYDGAGNMLEENMDYRTYGKEDGKLYYFDNTRREYDYDAQGNETGYRYYDRGTLSYRRTGEYVYDEEGRMQRATYYNEDCEYEEKTGYVYFYDEEGAVVLEYYRTYGDDWETVISENETSYGNEYDEEGRLLKEWEERTYDSGDKNTFETVYGYDDLGNKIFCEEWRNGKLEHQTFYENFYELIQES